jgi:hypothetical protein
MVAKLPSPSSSSFLQHIKKSDGNFAAIAFFFFFF